MGTAGGRWLLLAAIGGSGMALLDSTVVNVALPRIGTALGAGFGGLQWTLNGYTLMLASLILLGGALGDRYGRRRVFLVGVAWFAVASLLCGLALNVEMLVAARALQGIGGALLTPGSLSLISASFRASDRGAAVGAWSGLGGVAAAVGPLVGGWLVEQVSWRAVFLVNLPLAALVLWVGVRHVPESRDPQAPGRLDLTGALLTVVGLAALTYGLIAVQWVPVVVGLVALGAFVVVERRSRHPLVPLELFASRLFTAANLVTLAVYAALGGVFFLLVLQLQVVAGFSPVAAGLALLPVTALMLVLSARSGALAQRIGPRLQMTVGPLVAAAGLLLTLRIGPGSSYLRDVLPAVTVFGLGLACLVAPLTAAVLAAAPAHLAGTASGVNNAVARTAGLLAVAALPALVGLGGADYLQPAVFDPGFDAAMLICAGLLGAGAVVALVLVHGRPEVRQPSPAVLAVDRNLQCGVDGPPVCPRAPRQSE
ncbi:DHA2 family efflux MFS transporter permease subunit [Rhodococcus sp. X156]|uniref:DHA2 family efflux MFS transporter permease subunit n=1 Tax=Rhodococcus sp. X156 TaxID=2499145 RepID=UPI000FD93E74|nr:DHA2 family efflux MFS transporter permease subunit [Rhodococcus sp. X156]